ncbi:MAG: ATP-dependent Clp protease ATP-binding subunit ClpX [Planctomycetota bacterium]|jgi:ATP-dependent Clp protease ATP-binding subunit ClpX|nr:ATP-dependent Clp protease ATP-binding subunit ClpX [Planctomycetota bacterium]
MKASDNRNDEERCTFCSKSRRQVNNLIAGPPKVYICNECIELCNTILVEHSASGETSSTGNTQSGGGLDLNLDRLPSPSGIVAKLDEYVIAQEHAKKVLAVAVYTHYRRMLSRQMPASQGAQDDGEGVEIEKSNILLVGPTGSGKTLLARTLARILDVPFAIADATTLTEAGYVGEDVENIVLKVVQAADYNIQRAQQGIIFIDEIDKVSRTTSNVSITRDVSGEGVQQALLKLLEGTVANVPPQGGRKHPEQQYLQVDTRDILFIVGGTFAGIEDLVAKRVGGSSIGFRDAPTSRNPVQTSNDLISQVCSEDLVEYGLIPEFVGRIPIVAPLAALNTEELVRTITEPRNALVRQYQSLFALDDCDLEFTPEALRSIAIQALKLKTGVRAARSIIEAQLLDVAYHLPDRGPEMRYTVTPGFMRGEEPITMGPRNPDVRRESA